MLVGVHDRVVFLQGHGTSCPYDLDFEAEVI